MKCPRCNEMVVGVPESCLKCGFDLSLLRSLQELKYTLRRTQNESEIVTSRLHELERQVTSLEPRILPQQMPTAVVATPDPPTVVQEAISASAPDVQAASTHTVSADRAQSLKQAWARLSTASAASRSSTMSGLAEARLGEKWLLIAGLVLTILAVGYFLKYSFDRNWVGPAGRVSLAYLAGIGMLSCGEFCRRKKTELFGLYLLGGGIAVLYFASYAAFHIYHLIDQSTAFGLMALVTAFAGLLAIFYDVKWLAVLGIIGGFLTPIVLRTGTNNQVVLMTYMAILNAGILFIAVFKQWNLLNNLGMTFTWLLFSAWFVNSYAGSKFWTTTIFLNLFFLTYAIAPFAYYLVRNSQQKMVSFSLTIPNAFIAFGYAYVTIRDHYSLQWVSVVTVAYSAIFLSMATFLNRRHKENKEAFVLLLAKGLLFLIITVPIIFSEHWTTVFWGIQAIVLLWAALKLGDIRLRWGAIVLLLIAVSKLFFYDYTTVFDLRVDGLYYPAGFTIAILERWLTILLTLGVIFRAAQMFKSHGFDKGELQENHTAIFLTLFGVLLFIVMNIEVAACFHDYIPRARFASISVLWALFATALMILGFAKNKTDLRRCSIGLFGVTIIKVFVRDISSVDTPYRILSFLVLGLMLVGASYLYHRFKDRILPPDEEAQS